MKKVAVIVTETRVGSALPVERTGHAEGCCWHHAAEELRKREADCRKEHPANPQTLLRVAVQGAVVAGGGLEIRKKMMKRRYDRGCGRTGEWAPRPGVALFVESLGLGE
jgi:hypothetical protein